MSVAWVLANQAHLELELDCLRARLALRVLWARQVQPSPSPESFSWQALHESVVDAALAGGDRARESQFYAESEGAESVQQRLLEARSRLLLQRQACLDAGAVPAIDYLCSSFALSSVERDILLLAAAPELSPAFSRVYGYLHDDAARRLATPYLAELVFGLEAAELAAVRTSLLPASTLAAAGLILPDAPGEPRSLAPLRVAPRVLEMLTGLLADNPSLAGLQLPNAEALPGELPPAHESTLRVAQRWLGERSGQPANVQLVVGVDDLELTFAATLAARLRLEALRVDAAELGGDKRSQLLELDRECTLSGALLIVDLRRLQDLGSVAQSLAGQVAGLRCRSLLLTPRALASGPATLVLHLPRATAELRRRCWERLLPRMAADVSGIADAFPLGDDAIRHALLLAKARAESEGRALTKHDLWSACRRSSLVDLGDLGQRLEAQQAWDDLVLPPALLAQLEALAAQVANARAVYHDWGFAARLARGRGISALFSGPSGAGKTMAAEVIAARLELELIRVDLSGVVSKYVGETERNLKRVFEAAERTGAILFFDEADALFGKRTEVRDSHDRYANIEVNYLLQRMEEYPGLAILATNRRSTLDRAFLRRLRFVLDFPFPDSALRKEIWRRMFPKTAPVGDLDWDALARLELAGGNIKVVAVNAAFLAAQEGTRIEARHVFEAARWEFQKLEKSFSESDLKRSLRQVSNGQTLSD